MSVNKKCLLKSVIKQYPTKKERFHKLVEVALKKNAETLREAINSENTTKSRKCRKVNKMAFNILENREVIQLIMKKVQLLEKERRLNNEEAEIMIYNMIFGEKDFSRSLPVLAMQYYDEVKELFLKLQNKTSSKDSNTVKKECYKSQKIVCKNIILDECIETPEPKTKVSNISVKKAKCKKVSSNVNIPERSISSNVNVQERSICKVGEPIVPINKAENIRTHRLSESPVVQPELTIPDTIAKDSCTLRLSMCPDVQRDTDQIIPAEKSDFCLTPKVTGHQKMHHETQNLVGSAKKIRRNRLQVPFLLDSPVCCPKVLVGSFKLPLRKGEEFVPVFLSRESFTFRVPASDNPTKMTAVELKAVDICYILACFENSMPVMFAFVTPTCANFLRNLLHLPKQEHRPTLHHDDRQRIAFFVQGWSEEHRDFLCNYPPWKSKVKNINIKVTRNFLRKIMLIAKKSESWKKQLKIC